MAVTWNVENYFDTQHDSLKSDTAFLPSGEYRWTPARFAAKRNNIYKVIVDMGGDDFNVPALVALQEVENDRVLRELCMNTPLRKLGYDYIHFESPDARGVDCAVIYRKDRFAPFLSKPICVSDTAAGFRTRDLLLVEGVMDGKDTVCLVVCHLPSKRGGAAADIRRLEVVRVLRHTLDTLQQNHPDAVVMAMGDFNAGMGEDALGKGLGLSDGVNPEGFYDLTYSMPNTMGSYKYQGRWDYIDHILINRKCVGRVFAADYLLKDEKGGLGQRPFRTYQGTHYSGGYSDHLPLMVEVK